MENHGDQRLFSSRIEKLCSIVKDFSNRVKNTNSKELVVSGCPLVIHRFRTLKLKVRDFSCFFHGWLGILVRSFRVLIGWVGEPLYWSVCCLFKDACGPKPGVWEEDMEALLHGIVFIIFISYLIFDLRWASMLVWCLSLRCAWSNLVCEKEAWKHRSKRNQPD